MFIDRSRPLRIDFKLKDKVAGAISVGASRNGGQETTISAIHQFLLIQDAIVVGDGAPKAHYGGTGVGGAKMIVKVMKLVWKPPVIWALEWRNWPLK
jgi:multimeric flavodoxin WrbA